MPFRLDSKDADFERRFGELVTLKRDADGAVDDAVKAILSEIRGGGDEALLAATRRFDGWNPANASDLRVDNAAIDAAERAIDGETRAALELAAERIADYHRRQKPEDISYKDDAGLTLGARWLPVDAAGIYVPGGTAAYPSSVLMNALPARVAGVGRIVMVTPATGGTIDPLVLLAAKLAGVEEIYRIGGAQAVGALAFGTETIGAVDKIVGPGNAYVASAKRQIFGIVGIDMVAGPSEVLVVADNRNRPDWIAADLLSQAEHDTAAQAVLITDDAKFADAVAAAVDDLLERLPRRRIAAESWARNGAVIVVRDLNEAPALVDRLAPEHLELAVSKPEVLAARVRHAGAIFLGRHAPEALGDYLAGPNHVLPTSRSARFASGLGTLDFLKRTSLIACDRAGLGRIGPAAARLATAEGLDAHALSVSLRLADDAERR